MSEQKKNAVRGVFTVKHKRYLTPHYIRVTLAATDQQLEPLRGITVGGHNKLFIPPKGVNVIEFPDRDNPILTPNALNVRTYTTRQINFEQHEIGIDFVVHGDNGLASAWAMGTEPGDVLGVVMKVSSQPIVPQTDRYVLIGDATALPVIGAILESLSTTAQATVILEVRGKEDELVVPSPANVQLQWVHNAQPEAESPLADVALSVLSVRAVSKPFVFIAAEQRTVRTLRSYLKYELGLVAGQYSATAYWTAGESEEQSVSKRRAEMRD